MTDPHREKAREIVDQWYGRVGLTFDDRDPELRILVDAIAAYGRERYDAAREDAAKYVEGTGAGAALNLPAGAVQSFLRVLAAAIRKGE